MGSIDHEFQEAVRQGITVKELEEISERSAQFVTDARTASHTMVLAGVQFRRAANEWVPKIKAGEEGARTRSEEHTSELQSLMRISYAVFCLDNNRAPSDMTRTHLNPSH